MKLTQSKILYLISLLILIILSLYLINLFNIWNIFLSLLKITFPIFFGYIFAWILNPVYKKLKKKLNGKISLVLLIMIVILFYSLFLLLLVPIITKESSNLISVFKSYIPKVQKIPYISYVFSYLSLNGKSAIKYFSNVISTIILFVLSNMFGFYILYNYNSVNNLIKRLIPNNYKTFYLKLTKKISSCMHSYIKGTLIDTLILFISSSILFTIIGLNYSIVLGLFCALTNIIPFIGPYIGGVPAVLIGLSSSLKLAILTLIIIIICQTVESNIVNPLIMSKCTKVNPLLILIAITILGKFFGILGMIFAVPILIIVKIIYELKN